MLDGMSDSIQRSRIENLHSREVDRQSPTGLILLLFKHGWLTVSNMAAVCCNASAVCVLRCRQIVSSLPWSTVSQCYVVMHHQLSRCVSVLYDCDW